VSSYTYSPVLDAIISGVADFLGSTWQFNILCFMKKKVLQF